MLFSIIVPVYNVEQYLKECIDSILNQTVTNFEIILVDDGSTDSSGEICDQYALNHGNIKVIHKKNGGLSSAWVEGLNFVEGEYICSIDSDDYVECDLLESLQKKIELYSCDILVYGYKSFGAVETVNEIRADSGFYDRKKIESDILPSLINVGNLGKRSCIYLSRINKVIKKELFIKNKKYYRSDISYGEDNMWTIPNVLTASSMYVFSDYYPYCYRNNPGSITHSYNTNLWHKFQILDKQILFITNSLGFSQMEKQVKRDIVFHAVMTINNEMLSNEPKKTVIQNISRVIKEQDVVKGLKYMDFSSCSRIEKINLILVKLGNARLIYFYKSFRTWIKNSRNRLLRKT